MAEKRERERERMGRWEKKEKEKVKKKNRRSHGRRKCDAVDAPFAAISHSGGNSGHCHRLPQSAPANPLETTR